MSREIDLIEALEFVFGPMNVITIDVPEGVVLCDLCNDDFTHSEEEGGFLFSSKAVCPHCAPEFEKTAAECEELHYIKKRCREGQSFRDFVLEIRGETK